MTSPSPPENSDSEIKGAMAKGAVWMTGMRWCLRLIGLINTIILARLLSPDDFGIIAMAMVVVGLMEHFSDFYVDQVLLREKTLTKEMYDSAWTIQLLLGIGMGTIIFLSAPLIAGYYSEPRVELVVQIVAGRAVLSGFVNIGVVDFRRNLEFGREFQFWVYARLAQFVLALGLVLYFRTYLAMALSVPLAMLIQVVISYGMSSYRPRICLAHVKPFWNFAKWLIVTNVAQFANQRGDEFVVGSVAPAQTVGAYYIASDISVMLTREIINPTGRAFLPVYSKLTDQVERLASIFHLVVCFAAMVAFPVGVGASIVADDFVNVVLGEKWQQAIPFFQWLALYGALAGFVAILRPMLVVQGHERIIAFTQIGQALLGIPLLFMVANLGEIIDVAVARTGVMTFFFFVYCYVLVAYCRQTYIGILSGLWRPITASLIMAFVVSNLHHAVWTNKYLSLAFDIVVGGITYVFAVTLLWVASNRPVGAEFETYKWIRSKVSPASAM